MNGPRNKNMTWLDRALRHDHSISAIVHQYEFGLFDYVTIIPAMICGNHVMPFLVVFLTIIQYQYHGISFGGVLLLNVIFTVFITENLKIMTDRARPTHAHTRRRRFNVRGLLTNPSFPSGDSAQGAVVAVTMLFFSCIEGLGRHRVLHSPSQLSYSYLLLMPAVMFARVYYGAHWIGDTIAGVTIGALVSSIFCFLYYLLGLPHLKLF